MIGHDSRWLVRVIFGVVGLLASLHPPISDATAQTTQNDWSRPNLVVAGLRVGALASTSMIPIVDPYGDVHVFTSVYYRDDGSASIWYSKFTDAGWSDPVDIVLYHPLDVLGGAFSVAVDNAGMFHMVLAGGPVSYWRSSIDAAEKPLSWTQLSSFPLARQAQNASVVIDDDGNIHIAAAGGNSSPFGVWYTKSTDNGETWIEPVRVWENESPDIIPDNIVMAVSSQGIMHLVWSENPYPETYPPSGVYYSQSQNGGINWTSPMQMGGTYASRPAIALLPMNQVHVVWGAALADSGRYHRWSDDGGKTWSEVFRRQLRTGLSGPEQLTTDSADRLYWLSSFEEQEGSELLVWQNEIWIPSGERMFFKSPQSGVRTPVMVAKIVTQSGNLQRLFFRVVDSEGTPGDGWEMSRYVDSPQLQPSVRPSSVLLDRQIDSGDILNSESVNAVVSEGHALLLSTPIASARPLSTSNSPATRSAETYLIVSAMAAAAIVLPIVFYQLRLRSRH